MAKLFFILICAISAVAQASAGSAQDVLTPLPKFPFQGTDPISIVREAVPSKPFFGRWSTWSDPGLAGRNL
jgi:hypothetical protein